MLHYFFVVVLLVPWTALGIVLVLLGKLVNPGGWISHQLGRVWAWGILKASRMNLTIEGRDRIDPKAQYIFLANHTSAFDIPAVYWGVRNKLGMLAKKQLKYIPFFGWAMWAAGHFFVDRKDHKKAIAVMDQVAEQLSRDREHSLVIFPEGTRSLDGQVKAFKKGAFILSLNAGIPVVPILIKGAFEAKQKKSNRIQATTITLSIMDPIDPDQYSMETRQKFLDDTHAIFVSHLNHS